MALPTREILYRLKIEGTTEEIQKVAKLNAEITETKKHLDAVATSAGKESAAYAQVETKLTALKKTKAEIIDVQKAYNKHLAEEARLRNKAYDDMEKQSSKIIAAKNKETVADEKNRKQIQANVTKQIQEENRLNAQRKTASDAMQRQASANVAKMASAEASLQRQRSAAYVSQTKAAERLAAQEAKAAEMAAVSNRTWMQNFSSILKGGGLVNMVMQFTALYLAIRKVAQVFTYSIDQFKEFENTMKLVQAVTGATSSEIRKLSDSALALSGGKSIFSPQEIAAIQVEYAKMGFSVREILNVTKDTIAIATATGSTLSESAMNLAYTLRQYRISATDAAHVTDVMAAAFNQSALDATTYGEGMKYAGGVASSLNIVLEDTAAMLGILANAGIRGSMAGTSLRRIMTDMSLKGRNLGEALSELAARGINVTDAFDEVGRTAQTSLVILANNYPAVMALSRSMKEASGDAQRMATIMQTSLQGQLTMTTNATKELGIEIGNRLSPEVKGLAKWWRELANSVSGWLKQPTSEKIRSEILEVNDLVKQLSDYNIGSERKKLIWDQLLIIAPEVLAGMDKEHIKYKDINKQLEIYNKYKTGDLALAPYEDAKSKAYEKEATAVRNLMIEQTDYHNKKARWDALEEWQRTGLTPGLMGVENPVYALQNIKEAQEALTAATDESANAQIKYNNALYDLKKMGYQNDEKSIAVAGQIAYVTMRDNAVKGKVTVEDYLGKIELLRKAMIKNGDSTAYAFGVTDILRDKMNALWKAIDNKNMILSEASKREKAANMEELRHLRDVFNLEIERRKLLNDKMESTTDYQKLLQKLDKQEIEQLVRIDKYDYDIRENELNRNDPKIDAGLKHNKKLAEEAFLADVRTLWREYYIKQGDDKKTADAKALKQIEDAHAAEMRLLHKQNMEKLDIQNMYDNLLGNSYEETLKKRKNNIDYYYDREIETARNNQAIGITDFTGWIKAITIIENQRTQAHADNNKQIALDDKQARTQLFQAEMQLSGQVIGLMYRDAKYKEELAWFTLGIDTASAIAGGINSVSQSTDAHWAVKLAGYIAIVGSIVSAISTASSYMSSAPTYAFGGIAEDGFPKEGGVIGGRPHSQGGTKFWLGGRANEAEAGERHVIVKKGNSDWDIPILSAINEANGGKRFGARSTTRFDYGGIAPNITNPTQYTSGAIDYEMLARYTARAMAKTNIIVQVKDVSNGLDSYNNSKNNVRVW